MARFQPKSVAWSDRNNQETRKELKRTADAQEKSEKALSKQIDTMRLSAEISALNVIIEHYGMIMQKYTNGGQEYWNAYNEQKPYLKKLQELLNELTENK
ncbi:hypothetical protein GM418_30610 [Maribellus comscasis]|uniref:Uncharacterized protein n=1 Tax=Maribellus comscasis TaxID=2681766 RepID=A0A6I6K5U7_9BACT|nr:hypothetical protein [Maribellus comscasis]QGY47852.1 hypothetical protein GM418_30610 [Maribellus comscasis]